MPAPSWERALIDAPPTASSHRGGARSTLRATPRVAPATQWSRTACGGLGLLDPRPWVARRDPRTSSVRFGCSGIVEQPRVTGTFAA